MYRCLVLLTCRRYGLVPKRQGLRFFKVSSVAAAKPLPPRPTIVESDIQEAFLKGSGPGGQKINKTSSAVQLKHLPSGLVVKSQETRSRTQNRKIARRILAEKLEEADKGPESRTQLKAEVKRKKKASKSKKANRKYRRLEDDQQPPEAKERNGDELDEVSQMTQNELPHDPAFSKVSTET
ncbi:hypothetical protein LTR28_005468 [Elasticomyces elasticus]|nr:hypothetical protein LTR28_005468 [Elasticomyces elasticus]